MEIIQKKYKAEVIISILNESPLSEQKIAETAIDTEVKINSLPGFEYDGSLVGVRLHLKGE
jgi:hypothetical protein